MDDQEIWRAFDSHPEGLNEGEVAAKILKHGDNQILFAQRLRNGAARQMTGVRQRIALD
jgi:hypothetical protein